MKSEICNSEGRSDPRPSAADTQPPADHPAFSASGTASHQPSPFVALALIVPVPTIAVLFGMVWFPGRPLGNLVFSISKIWVLIWPAFWWLKLARRGLSWSPSPACGLLAGAAFGLVTAAVIFIVNALLGARLLAPEVVRSAVTGIRLSTPCAYVAGAAYWTFVNSLIEEVVWRWFVLHQCRRVMPARSAVIVASLAFTVHHFAAMPTFLGMPATLIAGFAIFVGAAVWGACYVRYKSIWPGYIAHVLADLAFLAIGYRIMFG